MAESILDWFKKVYLQPESKSPADYKPYFHMPADRPKGAPARHNLQQDLIDAIRASSKGQDPEMIAALISYIESKSGLKTFASNVPDFLKGVMDKRKQDIRNLLYFFFDENPQYLLTDADSFMATGALPEEAEIFTEEVLKNAEKLWLDREFQEVETVDAVGPDGKIKTFEKSSVPPDYKTLNETLAVPAKPLDVPLKESKPILPNKPIKEAPKAPKLLVHEPQEAPDLWA